MGHPVYDVRCLGVFLTYLSTLIKYSTTYLSLSSSNYLPTYIKIWLHMWMLPIIKIVMLKDLINCIYFSESILFELSRLVKLFVIDCIRSKMGFDTGWYPLLSIISIAFIFFIGCKQRSDSNVGNSTSCDRMHFRMTLIYFFLSMYI